MTQPVVFISYSYQDEKEKEQLLSHLSVLQRERLIELWSEDRIVTGADWKNEMSQAMAQAKIAILLISANYLSSDFILDEAVPALLRRHEREGLIIYPLIAKPCAWRTVGWLTRMKFRPRDGQPIWREEGRHADDELSGIAEEIAQILREDSHPFLFPPADPPPFIQIPSLSSPPFSTPLSTPQIPPTPQLRRSETNNYLPWLLIAGGIIGLIVLATLAWIVPVQGRPTPTFQAIPTDELPPVATFTLTPSSPRDLDEVEPHFGEIEFAEGFKNGKPVGTGIQFPKGIIEVHAVFEYYGMSPDHTWKRVWYLEGDVVSENSAKWQEASEGIFGLFLKNNGQPLLSGTWRLELYIDDKLVQEGSFTIN